jgi:putative hydrolase of the HAD superfamily
MPFRAVFFDVGETLLAPYPSFTELFAEVLRGLGFMVSPDDVEEALMAVATSVGDAIASSKTTWSTSRDESRRFWRGLYGAMLERWGIPDESGEVFDALYGRFTSYEAYRLFPDVIPTLTACRAAGLTLGIVSNFEEWLEGMLIEMEVAPFFSFMVISGKEGIEKPDPAIFRLALERSGVTPGEAVFVGDHPQVDIAAASELGMTGVLVDRHGRYPDFPGPRVERLTDLLAIVGANGANGAGDGNGAGEAGT